MAYDKKQLLKQCLEIIDDKKLFFFTDVYGILGISSSTFYSHFPKESKEYKELEQAITKQKMALKVSMRNKWYKSENATLQMGLMKLISTDEERKRLSQQHIDHTTDDKPITPDRMIVEVVDYSGDIPEDEELDGDG